MRGLILMAIVTLAYAKNNHHNKGFIYGYNKRVAIPLGEEIRKQEEVSRNQGVLGRISGGSLSDLEQFPYHAGVLTSYNGINGTGICGGSLVSSNRIIHAAHCWFDGVHQGRISEVVLGSVTLFYGGSRQTTSNIITHPQWNPELSYCDVAVIYLSNPVQMTSTIAPIALPSESQLHENFAGEVAVASGFGRTNDTDSGKVTLQQTLSHVYLEVITNEVCNNSFPNNVYESNICTSGQDGSSVCSGDSGGPLAVVRNGQPLLIGIASFGSFWGCTWGFPAAFSRVTSFMSFFKQHVTPTD